MGFVFGLFVGLLLAFPVGLIGGYWRAWMEI